MADPPLLGGDDGGYNTVRIAQQIAIQTRRTLDLQAHTAATLPLRTFSPALLEAVRSLPDNDLAQLVEVVRESESQDQFDADVQKEAPAGLIGLLSKRENRAELYEILKTVAAMVAAGAAVTKCAADMIHEKPAIIQQAPPPAEAPTPPQHRLTPPSTKI